MYTNEIDYIYQTSTCNTENLMDMLNYVTRAFGYSVLRVLYTIHCNKTVIKPNKNNFDSGSFGKWYRKSICMHTVNELGVYGEERHSAQKCISGGLLTYFICGRGNI